MTVHPRRAAGVHPSAANALLAILAFIAAGCATTAKPPPPSQLPAPQWESAKLIESKGGTLLKLTRGNEATASGAVTTFFNLDDATACMPAGEVDPSCILFRSEEVEFGGLRTDVSDHYGLLPFEFVVLAATAGISHG